MGVCGGLFGGLGVYLGLFFWRGGQGLHHAAALAAFCGGGVAACGLVGLAEQLAARWEARYRLWGVLVMASGSTLAAVMGGAWAVGLVNGGPNEGWRLLEFLIAEVATLGSTELVGFALMGLVPIVGFVLLRARPPHPSHTITPRWQWLVRDRGGGCGGHRKSLSSLPREGMLTPHLATSSSRGD